jgi:hypothetical protein
MLVERIESGGRMPSSPRLHKAAFHIVARESTGESTGAATA